MQLLFTHLEVRVLNFPEADVPWDLTDELRIYEPFLITPNAHKTTGIFYLHLSHSCNFYFQTFSYI